MGVDGETIEKPAKADTSSFAATASAVADGINRFSTAKQIELTPSQKMRLTRMLLWLYCHTDIRASEHDVRIRLESYWREAGVRLSQHRTIGF